MKNPLPRRVYITVIVLALAYAACLEVCAQGDAALVVLGAGSLAKVPAIAAMLALVLLRVVLYLVVPGWVAMRLVLGLLPPARTANEDAGGRGMPRA